MSIGFKIKKLREKNDLSQQDLAFKLDISQTKLSNIENDSTEKIDFVLMDKICSIFGVDFSYFLETESKQINKVKSKELGLVNNHGTINMFPENILQQVKTLIEDNKQKEARIRELEQLLNK